MKGAHVNAHCDGCDDDHKSSLDWCRPVAEETATESIIAAELTRYRLAHIHSAAQQQDWDPSWAICAVLLLAGYIHRRRAANRSAASLNK